MKLNPSYIERNGKKEYAVLPYEEFTALQELLHDVEDLLELRQAKLADDTTVPSISLDKLIVEFGLSS